MKNALKSISATAGRKTGIQSKLQENKSLRRYGGKAEEDTLFNRRKMVAFQTGGVVHKYEVLKKRVY